MVTHSECLYNGEVIGIDYIITAKDGKQINIPDRTEWLKQQGREGKLFCTCKCGATLIVVASDQLLKCQHFRTKTPGSKKCTDSTRESEETLWAKIALKCWLADKLSLSDVKMNVPINTVTDHDRRYEYSLYSRDANLGILYWKSRKNILDERISILDIKNENKVIYIVGEQNDICTGQYQEYMIKIQKKQGYCLFLYFPPEYEKDYKYQFFKLKAVIFCEKNNAEWKEIVLAEGMLTDFCIDDETGDVLYNNEKLSKLGLEAVEAFFKEQRAIEEQKQQEEYERKQAEIAKKAELDRINQERLETKRKHEEAEAKKQAELKKLIEAQCLELGVYDIDLMSKDEAQKVRGSLLKKAQNCWLSTKGNKPDQVYVLYDRGYIESGDVNFIRGIRPVLRLRENMDDPYCVDQMVELAGHTFTVISEDAALCNDLIGKGVFREDSAAADANEYSVSDVKKQIDEWCKKNYIKFVE